MSNLPDTTGLEGLWGKDFLTQTPPEINWLVEGLLVMGGTSEIYARTGMGKTWFALQLIGSVLGEDMFLGTYPVKRPGLVVYVQAELDSSQLSARMSKVAQTMAGMADPGPWMPAPQFSRIMWPAHKRQVQDAIARIEPVMLLLDPFRKMPSVGDMNNEQAVNELLDWLDLMRIDGGPHICVVHHPRKQRTDIAGNDIDGGMDESGGNRALPEWAECIMRLQGDPAGKPDSRQKMVIQKLRHTEQDAEHSELKLRFDRATSLFVPDGTPTAQRPKQVLTWMGWDTWTKADLQREITEREQVGRSSAYDLITSLKENGQIVEDKNGIRRIK